ncbi:MAG: C-terminal binding protein [Phycisphaerales bacterium]|nr:C-terminal binding protein [Phycisphaerales bacterium]
MKVLVSDYGFANLDIERQVITHAGFELVAAQCKTADEVVAAGVDAAALLVQWAPITREVIAKLLQCRLIVRYGIGVDNVYVVAAKARGIPVCNVPDYCIEEVADHAMAMALALARQLPQVDRRVRGGVWKITPDAAMPALGDMTFATAGLGRIARAFLTRARAFGVRLAAFDPFVPAEVFAAEGIAQLTLEQLLQQADVLSLHLPLTPQTRGLINLSTLAKMKCSAILINTARGGLVDGAALAAALQNRVIAGAGVDVFEAEPLPQDHPLRQCDNALLTSHIGWFSERSVPKLQRLAAEEVVRGLRGEPLKNKVLV